jgi:hypothetical protein
VAVKLLHGLANHDNNLLAHVLPMRIEAPDEIEAAGSGSADLNGLTSLSMHRLWSEVFQVLMDIASWKRLHPWPPD